MTGDLAEAWQVTSARWLQHQDAEYDRRAGYAVIQLRSGDFISTEGVWPTGNRLAELGTAHTEFTEQ